MAKSFKSFVSKRYGVFVLISLGSLIVPFVTIGEYHLLLLSFNHGRLELLGANFDAQELIIIPPLLILGFIFLFFLTSLGGRVWCGWFCPQTIFRSLFRDGIQGWLFGLRKWKWKDRPPKTKAIGQKLKFVLSYIILLLLMAIASANILWYFVVPKEFFVAFLEPLEHQILLGLWAGTTAFLWFDIGIWGESFCAIACPYARIQTVMFDEDTLLVLYDAKRGNNSDGSMGNKNFAKEKDHSGDCIGCNLCVKVCPAGIDIRQGLQLPCIECLECVDVCAPIMAKKGKENLIHWASTKSLDGEKFHLFRARTIIYFLVMVALIGVILNIGRKQVSVLANINRATGLYAIKLERVENHYILLLSNKTSQKMEVKISLGHHKKIELLRPKGSFFLRPKGRVKKVLVLGTKENLNPEGEQDKSIPIEIMILQKNGTELNELQSIFIYPSKKELKAKR